MKNEMKYDNEAKQSSYLEISDPNSPLLLEAKSNAISDSKHRMICFDALRGLLMIVAAEDHTRFIIAGFPGEEYWSGMNPDYYNYYNKSVAKTIYIFLTRLITHIAAPGFYLLMGFGMVQYYQHRKQKLKWTTLQIIKYFTIRGSIIAFIGAVILNFAMYRNYEYSDSVPGGPIGQAVYWSPDILFPLGVSMVIFAPIIACESYCTNNIKYCGIILIVLILLICLILTEFITPKVETDAAATQQNTNVYSWIIVFLFISGQTGWVYHNFTLIPWFAPLCIGILYGRLFIYLKMVSKIEKFFFYMKLSTIVFCFLFIIIRFNNKLIYSDNINASFGNFYVNWNWNEINWNAFQFFRTTKFPPSIAHLCFTISLLQMCLLLFYQLSYVCKYNIWFIFTLFGRVTLFCWVFHWFLLLPLGSVFGFVIDLIWKDNNTNEIVRMICIWPMLLVLCGILYKPAKWYLNFKRKKSSMSLWRLL